MERIKDAHQEEYGARADCVAVAPGRFHLVGEHSWFFKDKTLSMAINLPVFVAVSRRSDANLRFYFVQTGDRKRCGLGSLKFRREDKWANAVKAVIYGFTSGGFDCGGMNVTVSSDMLPSAGFGITTAIKMASLLAIQELHGFRCSPDVLLQVMERANRLYFGAENIKADSFTLLFSEDSSVVMTDYAKNTCDVLPFPFADKTIILTDTRVPRVMTWNEESLQQPENVLLLGELKERRAHVYGGWRYEASGAERNEVLSVVNEDTRRRLLCIMDEHRCVLDAVAGLKNNDFTPFARAVNRSHKNLRDLYDISCPETDWILKRVQELDSAPDDMRNPVNCGRISGKGFGRCIYTILRTGDVEKYKEKLAEYERIFGFTPEWHVVAPARGVHLL